MSSTCYTDNGDIAFNQGPCNPDNIESLCCASGEICLSNGLCATDYGSFYAGSCTDKQFKASTCPNFCSLGLHSMSSGIYTADLCGKARPSSLLNVLDWASRLVTFVAPRMENKTAAATQRTLLVWTHLLRWAEQRRHCLLARPKRPSRPLGACQIAPRQPPS